MMPGSKGLSPHEFAEYFALYLDKEHTKKELPVFEQSPKWLDLYFSGRKPDSNVPLHFTGTDFQNEVSSPATGLWEQTAA